MTVTFLFTDIEGSTGRWEAQSAEMGAALAKHDDALRTAIEGHGGILEDPEAIDQTMRTIVERRVPPDERSRVLLAAAQQGSERIGGIVLATLCALAFVVCLSAFAIRSPIVAPFSSALSAFLPRASRKPCP